MLPTYVVVGMLIPALPLLWWFVVLAIILFSASWIYAIVVIQVVDRQGNALAAYIALFFLQIVFWWICLWVAIKLSGF